jgi:hypothetical protein
MLPALACWCAGVRHSASLPTTLQPGGDSYTLQIYPMPATNLSSSGVFDDFEARNVPFVMFASVSASGLDNGTAQAGLSMCAVMYSVLQAGQLESWLCPARSTNASRMPVAGVVPGTVTRTTQGRGVNVLEANFSLPLSANGWYDHVLLKRPKAKASLSLLSSQIRSVFWVAKSLLSSQKHFPKQT